MRSAGGRGLSPLARGTPSPVITWRARMRFIPAGAGNSKPASIAAARAAVYPRWRGELLADVAPRTVGTGLPPLARGTLEQPKGVSAVCRFTPAGAGNSTFLPPVGCSSTVYPRWRGELCHPVESIDVHLGLPPLARGTQFAAGLAARHARFTPAGAGNSKTPERRDRAKSVYPRWRGELSKSIHLFLKHFFP